MVWYPSLSGHGAVQEPDAMFDRIGRLIGHAFDALDRAFMLFEFVLMGAAFIGGGWAGWVIMGLMDHGPVMQAVGALGTACAALVVVWLIWTIVKWSGGS